MPVEPKCGVEPDVDVITAWTAGVDNDDSSVEVAYCCLPSGCAKSLSKPICLNDLHDAVKVVCTNESCDQGNWMHAICFQEWELKVVAQLRSTGKARGWSEKQRVPPNLWTRKGSDLSVKACECKCGQGHLRLDVTTPLAATEPAAVKSDDRKQQRKQRKKERLLSGGAASSSGSVMSSQLSDSNYSAVTAAVTGGTSVGVGRQSHRIHRLSMSSTGSSSSPPSSAGTTPCTPSGHFMPQSKKNKFDFFADADQAAAGNIFRHRTNLTAFGCLPRFLQNPYHIKTEDDGPHGNDETRCFLLTSLSAQKVTSVMCVICQTPLCVYDKYPLIDGTFFLSPLKYNSDLQVIFEHRPVHLNAVCMRCMEGSRVALRCRGCDEVWSGRALVIGTMYSFDIFAAAACCNQRLQCKQCQRAVADGVDCLQHFSDYSRRIKCQNCAAEDFHFVKRLDDVFCIEMRSSESSPSSS